MGMKTSCTCYTFIKDSGTNFIRNSWIVILLLTAVTLTGCITPTPDEEIKDRLVNSKMDLEAYNALKPELVSGLTLNKAIELGMQYNLELWLTRQEMAIQSELKNGAITKMLPDLTAEINNGLRDSHNASNSVGLFTGQEAQNVTYSYSDMTSHTYGGVNLLWNVLDFGVSYFRARQQGKRTLHALHEIRRIRQKLSYDIAEAYWSCVGLELIVERGESLKTELESEINAIGESQAKGRISESAAIERRYPLKQQLLRLEDYNERYQSAKLRLAQLIGLPIGADFTIDCSINEAFPALLNLDKLETLALNQRPELFQEDLQEKITQDEARATMLSMLPSPQMFVNPSADDNKYLYYNSWLSAGINVSWNLLDIPNKVFKTRSEFKRVDFIRKKRMALAVAIITQLRIAAIEYDFAVSRYHKLQDIVNDSEQIIANAESAAKAGKGKQSQVTTKKLDALRDFAASMQAYSRVMIARAKIINTIGADTSDTAEISESISIQLSPAEASNNGSVYSDNLAATDTPASAITTETSSFTEATVAEAPKPQVEQVILNQYSPDPKGYF